jgi:hypothetical protein
MPQTIIYTAKNKLEADIVIGYLRAHGVRATSEPSALYSPSAGQFPTPQLQPWDVAVNGNMQESARALLKNFDVTGRPQRERLPFMAKVLQIVVSFVLITGVLVLLWALVAGLINRYTSFLVPRRPR